MSTTQIHGSLFVSKAGKEGTSSYTIITTERRDFHALDGTACIVESTHDEALRAWLSSDYAENLAKSLDVEIMRISRMRIALNIGYGDGGNRRAMTHDDAPNLSGRLKVVDSGKKKIVILSGGIDTWQLVPGTNIIIQPTAKPHLKRWMQQSDVASIATKMQIGKSQVTAIKRLLGILR